MSHSPEIEALVKEEAIFGRLPLLPNEREYDLKGISATGFAYAVAAWCFLIGGYSANVVGAVQGMVTLIAGCVLGVALSAVASALACNRYGLEQIDFSKTCFGQKGSKYILFFYVINQLGWTGIILVMCAHGVTNLLGFAGLPKPFFLVSLVTLVGLAACYWIVIRGVHILNVFNMIITPGLVLITLFIFYAVFREHGWAGILAAQPISPGPDHLLNFMISFEGGLGAGFSWWPGIGFLARNTNNQKNSFYPQVLTMGLGMGIVCCTGLFAGILYHNYDPTVWMPQVGGIYFGVAALALVALANVAASSIMMYTAGLAMRHVNLLRGWSWKWLMGLCFLPVLAFVIAPDLLYEKGNVFLAFNATMYGPISGLLLVDYLFLRKQRLNASQVFEGDSKGHYYFFGGFNWYALACVILGQVLYIFLYNPATGITSGPFKWLTASGPSILIPAVLYYILARLFVLPKAKGGYGAPIEPIALREPNI